MSYINKPGKTSAWRSMVVRQQISDVLSHHQIVTTLTKAKITQKYLESLITMAKTDNLSNRRRAARVILQTKIFKRDDLITHLFTKIAPKFKSRNGGYTRVIKKGPRRGDAVEEAVLQFVIPLPSPSKPKTSVRKEPKKNKESTVKNVSESVISKKQSSVKDHTVTG